MIQVERRRGERETDRDREKDGVRERGMKERIKEEKEGREGQGEEEGGKSAVNSSQ